MEGFSDDKSSIEALLERSALEGRWGKLNWFGPRLITSFDISSGLLKYGPLVSGVEIAEDLLLVDNPLLPNTDIRMSTTLKTEGGSGTAQFGLYLHLKNISPFKKGWLSFKEEPSFVVGLSSVGSGADNWEALLGCEQQILPSLSMSTSLQLPFSHGTLLKVFPSLTFNSELGTLMLNPQQQYLLVGKPLSEKMSIFLMLRNRFVGGFDSSIKITQKISVKDSFSLMVGSAMDEMLSIEYCHVWNTSPVTLKEQCSTTIGFVSSPYEGVSIIVGVKFVNNSIIRIPIKMGEEMDFETVVFSAAKGIIGYIGWSFLVETPLKVLSRLQREGSLVLEPSLKVLAKKKMSLEIEKNGLVIKRAIYCGEKDVTDSLMAQCSDSSLHLGPMRTFGRIPGFGGIGCKDKNGKNAVDILYIEYTFRGILHTTTIKDGSVILLPQRIHLCQ